MCTNTAMGLQKVCAPADTINHHRCDHDNEEVPLNSLSTLRCRISSCNRWTHQPVRDGRQGVRFRSGLQRIDLLHPLAPNFMLERIVRRLTSAGYSQGSGNHVAPKNPMYVKSPTAAPLAALSVPGISAPKVSTMERHWPTVPIRNNFLRPTFSTTNQLVVAKMESVRRKDEHAIDQEQCRASQLRSVVTHKLPC